MGETAKDDRSWIGRLLGTPYTLREEMKWLWRNVVGASRKNRCSIVPLPGTSVLNRIDPAAKLAFVGDIMDLRGRRPLWGAGLREFIGPSDFLFGNFEATVTGCRRTYPAAQIHERSILDSLAGLFPPERTVLAVANNHAGDFSPAVFHESVSLLRERGFRVLGLTAHPFIDLPFPVRVLAATAWSNRPSAEIAFHDALERCVRPGALNIAYPHWGYELERFPRAATVDAGRRLLERFDAVIGHHSHTPQPVAAERTGDVVKLLAYSLGNFCSGLKWAKYRYGVACTVAVGPADDGSWRIGTVEWRFTEAVHARDNTVTVDLAPRGPG